MKNITYHVKKKKYRHFNTKAAATHYANEQKAHGHKTRTYYDSHTGEWIVEVLFLVVALGILGSFLKHQ